MSLKEIIDWTKARLNSENGKNILIFLVFLCVSAIFWLVLTLNDEYQRDISIPLEITELPDSVTLLSTPPQYINVSVRDKGSNLAKYQWGDVPAIKVNYKDFVASDNKLIVSQSQVNSMLHRYFGANSQILSVKPDSIALSYTSHPGVKIKVDLSAVVDVTAAPGYMVSRQPYCIPDSVTLFAPGALPRKLRSLTVETLSYSDLTDSVIVNATVSVPEGMRAVPDQVKVVMPVERLERKTRIVEVQVKNAPSGQAVTVTPSEVMVVYLVPASQRDKDTYPIHVTANYRERTTTSGDPKMPLSISILPDYYNAPQIYRVDNTDARIDSIEYVLEDAIN